MKVLMATMQLDIGGAETHIVELSKALARRGIEVFVASRGGAYVPELKDAGIKHFNVPLHSKSLSDMRNAYNLLERIILDNKIDVVHAHARIPGFICGLLHKKYNFRFVTTAHWVFDTRFPLNLLTNWGDRSLAVSDDIKQYLVDNYNCNPDKIRVTINGVDMEKFSENVDFSSVAKEFDFGKNKTRIVYVSRMDVDRSFAAHKLIEAVPDLFKQIPDLEVVVVGGGNDFEAINREAETMNKAMGHRLVITTNGRTDINKFVASGDVFVGVSRAALEAMACRKPAIIAGNEGYIGIFDEDKLQISIDTNFCCRGCEQTTTEKLRDDILAILNPDKSDYRKHLGDYSIETVKKYYSVETMADDAMKMYVSIIKNSNINEVDKSEFADIDKYTFHGNSKREIDVMLSGYYGFNNSGDDAILTSIISGLREKSPNIAITVLAKNPEELSKAYGVKAIDRFKIIEVFKALRKTKLLISGGGSLLQDVTSSKSLYYYLAIMRMAKFCGAKVMIYANGIGPINKKSNERKFKKSVNQVDLITLREKSSKDEVEKALVSDIPVFVTADPVFSLESKDDATVSAVLSQAGVDAGNDFFVIAVREWKYNDKNLESKVAEFAKYVREKYNLIPVVIPMQNGFDRSISEHVMAEIGGNCRIPKGDLSPEVMLGIISKAKLVLGMRLHTMIYAAKNGVPAIAIDYDPKVNAVMEAIEQKFIVKAENIDTKKLCEYADSIFANSTEISTNLLEKSSQYKTLAEKNVEMALGLLK